MPGRVLSKLIAVWLAVVSVNAVSQELGDPGVIELAGDLVQIAVNKRDVSVSLLRADEVRSTNIDMKVAQLTRQIKKFLKSTEAQEDRRLSDQESLYRATSYARKLIEKIELLNSRLAFLGQDHDLSKKIGAAAGAFDVRAIKELLKEKLALEDEELAEAAFHLGGFQELDGEYQDAWANYQKASNLEPDNQLYMDAHGKNEF
jgi:tetratricopeptide (TPR) repeat protein